MKCCILKKKKKKKTIIIVIVKMNLLFLFKSPRDSITLEQLYQGYWLEMLPMSQ